MHSFSGEFKLLCRNNIHEQGRLHGGLPASYYQRPPAARAASSFRRDQCFKQCREL